MIPEAYDSAKVITFLFIFAIVGGILGYCVGRVHEKLKK